MLISQKYVCKIFIGFLIKLANLFLKRAYPKLNFITIGCNFTVFMLLYAVQRHSMSERLRDIPRENISLHPENPWKNSSVIAKLEAQRKTRLEQTLRGEQPQPYQILLVDVDGTFQSPKLSPQTAQQIRAIADANNIPVIAVTSRTAEMTVSGEQYNLSPDLQNRPKPHLKKEGDKFIESPPEHSEGFQGLYDFDAMATQTGAHIHIRQTDGSYKKDRIYEAELGLIDSKWREQNLPSIQSLVDALHVDGVDISLETIDQEGAFEQGKVDVSPLDARIQVNFRAIEASASTGGTGATAGGIDVQEDAANRAIAAKNAFKKLMNEAKEAQGLQVDGIDDSNIAKGRASLYVVPPGVSKQRAVSEILRNITEVMSETRGNFAPIYCGDSFTDLLAVSGLADPDVEPNHILGTLLLVGDSRLNSSIQDAAKTGNDVTYAGEIMEGFKLAYTNTEGLYSLSSPDSLGTVNVVLGAETYPGTEMSETILAHLETQINNS